MSGEEMRFFIGDNEVGEGRPVFIVMEVAQAHDGSLGTAHAFVDLAAASGADAVKFQTHIAAAESTQNEPFRVKFSRQDANRYEYWKRMEFSPEQWHHLADHARERGLIFLSSPFSCEAVDLLEKCEVPAWKVGSGEINNEILLARLIQTRKPILLSTGMSTWEEIDAAVARIRNANIPLMLYQCTSVYPCPPEEVGLPLIITMKERYALPVGLSDHSGSPNYGIAAAALGAASVEVHMTLSRQAFGPDVPASLDPKDLKRMVEGIRQIESAMKMIVKDDMARELSAVRAVFGRSVVARTFLRKGTILTEDHLTVKKPAGGVPPSEMSNLFGKILVMDKSMDSLITLDDVCDSEHE